MPAKTPIYLKAANNKKGKKFKLRDILSPDMISPPLGDFRHTIHIGKEGQHDVFGDISFLQGNYELLPGNEGETRISQSDGHSEFLRANSTSESMFTETPSPVLKNAISLPAIGGSQALMLPLLPCRNPRLSCEPVMEEKLPEKSKQLEDGEIYRADIWEQNGSSSHLTNESLSDLTGSLLSLQLDLGPSLLDEVLNVMDKNKS
uniref:CDC42 effector protein 3 n=1 Tax=Nothoprocta perdicaria TaxID=30464 RepID=A0A8C7EC62_NOTPE